MNANPVDSLIEKLMQALPEGVSSLGKDIQTELRTNLHSVLRKMDLVTREEFEIQREVLIRSRQKLENLEKQVAELEQLIKNQG